MGTTLHQWLKVRMKSDVPSGNDGHIDGDAMVNLNSFEDAHYLTVAEVALAMRVSKMTVYRLVQARALPAVSFGKSYRIPAQAVKKYLMTEQHAAAPERLSTST
jgi:excisionase family DNA binding protein